MDMPNARPNPYVGPRPFQAGEKLYGRDREIRELLDHFIAERIVLLYSPSGAGKTSLLSAGLIPELVKNGFQVLPTIRVSIEQNVDGSGEKQGATDQGTGAAPHVNRYVLSTLLSLEEDLPGDQQIPLDELANLTILDYLTRRTNAKESDQEETGTTAQVLIFDQFEEVLTLNPTDKDGKTEFFAQVGAALRDRDRWALFVMREDYIGSVDPFVRPIPTRLNNRFRLDLLSEEAARQAMQQPANLAGVDFTDEAAIKLADDLRRVQVQQPDGTMVEQLGLYVEPVQLQVVCYRLWQLLPEETVVIGEPDLACLGDVNQSLAEYYAERVHLIAQSTGVRERLIRDWFQDKLITEHGIRSQVLKGVGQSDGLDNTAVVALENAYLIRAEKRRGVTWYELVHDRLIGPIRLNNEEWYATNLNVLQRQAARWAKEGQPDHLLLREQALEEAEVWAEGNQADLIPSELEYLEACRAARTREIEARELQNQAIKLEEQARSAKRLRALLIVAVIAAIAAIVFAYFAFGQKAKADDNADRANAASTQAVSQQEIAEFNAGVAIAQRATADVAREVAVTQQAIADAASTEAVAQQATAVYNADLADKNADEAARQASLASSRQLAAQSAGYFENNPSLSSLLAIESFLITDTWEAKNQLLLPLQRASAQQLFPYKNQIPPQPKDLRSVAISPDGKSLAFGSSDGKITLWNFVDNVEIWTKHAHESNRVVTLDFSPDGKYLASAAAGRILLWDLANPDPEPETLAAHVFNVAQIAFDSTGEQLAAAVGKRLYAYNIADRQQIGESLEYKQDIFGVAWSPEGDHVAGPAGDGALIVWQPDKENFERNIKGHEGPGSSIAWAQDGSLATGGQDGNIIFWDTDNWRPVGQPINAHRFGWVQSLAYSSDGRFLATGSDDKTVTVWDVITRQPVTEPLTDHQDWVVSVDFSPKQGQFLLASAGMDEHVYLYEISTIQGLGEELLKADGPVLGLAVSPDGALRLAVRQGNQIVVQQGTRDELQPSKPWQSDGSPIALSQDGLMLALGQKDGSVQIFDVNSGQEVTTLPAVSGELTALALNANGSKIAGLYCSLVNQGDNNEALCANTDLFIWDVGSGEETGTLRFDTPGFYRAVAFQNSGDLIAIGSDDGHIGLYDPEGDRQVEMAERATDGIVSLAFSPDDRTLASGNGDKSLQLWDVRAYQPIARRIYGSPDVLTSLAYAPLTADLYSGAQDGSVFQWLSAPDAWIALNCTLAGRNFTPEEWERFIPNVEYRKTCDQY